MFHFHIIYIQITKKLAGHAAGTAAWMTNVGNEHGQVLMSVLTEGEGDSLQDMASGLARRYQVAAVDPPRIMYVDRDCCISHGRCSASRLFTLWPDLQVNIMSMHYLQALFLNFNLHVKKIL